MRARRHLVAKSVVDDSCAFRVKQEAACGTTERMIANENITVDALGVVLRSSSSHNEISAQIPT